MDERSIVAANQSFGGLSTFLRKCLFGVLSVGPIPTHIAFIMDGNRRFAKRRNLPVGDGHKAGYWSLMTLLRYCWEMGVKCVTVYAFSIDNFRRPPEEVKILMDLLQEKIKGLLNKEYYLNRCGIRVYFIGNLKLLGESVRVLAEEAMKATASNSKGLLLVCLAYTSTDEIVHAVEESCKEKRKEIQVPNERKVNGVEEGGKTNGVIHGVKEGGGTNGVIHGIEDGGQTNGVIHGIEEGGKVNGVIHGIEGGKVNGVSNGVEEGVKVNGVSNGVEEGVNINGVIHGVEEGGKANSVIYEEGRKVNGVTETDVHIICQNNTNGEAALVTSVVPNGKIKTGRKVKKQNGTYNHEVASNGFAQEVKENEKQKQQQKIPQVKLVDIEKHMYMAVAPDPDILIRTSGETRLSNFLLWQTSDCPLYSPSALWPELGLWQLVWAVLNFQRHHYCLEKKKKQE